MRAYWLFVHIPRTGGTSIRRALGIDDPELHLTARAHRHRLGEQEYLSRHRFTIVRDPWDRAVSIFAFLWRHHPTRITPECFRAWVAGGMRHPDGRSPMLYAGTDYEISLTAPQAAWTRGDDGLTVIPFRALPWGGLPRENSVPRPDAEWYDIPTIDRITDIYRPDLEAFGFAPPSPEEA